MSRLFIVSGPSGAGKSSLCKALLESCPQLKLSISCTTRSPRPSELDGRDYHFLTPNEFHQQQQAGDFLEWAEVHGNFYGTRQKDVELELNQGYDVLLEIDWQGATQVANKIPSTQRVFILPPSIGDLKKRLTSRGQDDTSTIEQRVAAAEAEMTHAHEAHHRIINDDFKHALHDLKQLFQS
ncbi:MAG: guanylate kinase [Mariprofundaceae bacterium]|nr:guanylate kinase [Mariprofundaceae bacterium]